MILLPSKWKANHNKVYRAGGIERPLSFSFSASSILFGSKVVIYWNMKLKFCNMRGNVRISCYRLFSFFISILWLNYLSNIHLFIWIPQVIKKTFKVLYYRIRVLKYVHMFICVYIHTYKHMYEIMQDYIE